MKDDQINKLISYCRPIQPQLKKMLYHELRHRDRKAEWHDGFIYSPGTHPVLLVAHMDTVHKSPVTTVYIDQTTTGSTEGDLWATEGIGGDDRCGIYIAMEILRTHDCHVVFTEDEETGAGGARKFVQAGIVPEIDFIVEFDRKNGNDAVFYGCDNEEFVKFVEQFGWKKTFGSFSDISIIAPALKIAAVNLSAGYEQAHTEYEFIRIADVDSAVERGIQLVGSIGTKYEYVEKTITYTHHDSYAYYHNGYTAWDNNTSASDDVKKKRTKGVVMCQWCGEKVGFQDTITSNAFTNTGVKDYFCKSCVATDPELAKYITPPVNKIIAGSNSDDGIEFDENDEFCSSCQTWLSEPDGEIPCKECAIDREWYRNKKKENNDDWPMSMFNDYPQSGNDDFNWDTGKYRKRPNFRKVKNKKRRKHRKHNNKQFTHQ